MGPEMPWDYPEQAQQLYDQQSHAGTSSRGPIQPRNETSPIATYQSPQPTVVSSQSPQGVEDWITPVVVSESSSFQQQVPNGSNQIAFAPNSAGRLSYAAMVQNPLRKLPPGQDPLAYAEVLRTRGRLDEALSLYDAILAGNQTNVEAYVGRGMCLMLQKMNRSAFENFATVLTLDPTNVKALIQCGILYRQDGHHAEAVEVNNLSFLFGLVKITFLNIHLTLSFHFSTFIFCSYLFYPLDLSKGSDD